MASDTANLEAAFERITVTDENKDQLTATTTYHKSKVSYACCAILYALSSVL
jgi:aurora kinase